MSMREELRKNFIVTADDYGIRESSLPILRLARLKKIDRVAVLVHYLTPEEASDLVETGVKIDLHLELISLLQSGHKLKDHALTRGLRFTWRYVTGRIPAHQVEKQWRDQIERFQELFGRYPDGLNSHEHVHYFSSFFRVFLALAEEYKISYVRFGKRGIRQPERKNIVAHILDFFWKRDHERFAETKLHTSDWVMNVDWLTDVPLFFENEGTEVTELVVHPEREEEYKLINEYL